jgi:hypothetical protein
MITILKDLAKNELGVLEFVVFVKGRVMLKELIKETLDLVLLLIASGNIFT